MCPGVPTQTREELLDDMKGIATLQERYDILSVLFGIFSLGMHVPLYMEREKYEIEDIGRNIVFSTTSGEIHRNDWLIYRYKNKSAYDLLSPNHLEINSPIEALKIVREMEDEVGINKNNRSFIYTINDFLFETQLFLSMDFQPSRLSPNRLNRFLKQVFRLEEKTISQEHLS
jgi:hypothetical protein